VREQIRGQLDAIIAFGGGWSADPQPGYEGEAQNAAAQLLEELSEAFPSESWYAEPFDADLVAATI
jgi:hypothetical protein